MEVLIVLAILALIIGFPIFLIVLIIACACSSVKRYDYKYFSKIFNPQTAITVASCWNENKSRIYRSYLQEGFEKKQLTEEQYREFLHYFYLLDNYNKEELERARIKQKTIEFENALRNI